MFTLLSSNLSLTRFSQHISTCNTRFDVSNGIISVHTSHNFQMVSLYAFFHFLVSLSYHYFLIVDEIKGNSKYNEKFLK